MASDAESDSKMDGMMQEDDTYDGGDQRMEVDDACVDAVETDGYTRNSG